MTGHKYKTLFGNKFISFRLVEFASSSRLNGTVKIKCPILRDFVGITNGQKIMMNDGEVKSNTSPKVCASLTTQKLI